jgi:choline dehydrogenase
MKQDAFDYIVVGAGSAGCIVASRLAEDPACRVLLLEAGGTDRTRFCTQPGMITMVHTVPEIKKRFDWGYYTAPQKHALGRKIPYVRGKVLGGSSAINGMLFVRGNKANYESWAAEGCAGWGYADVLPYYKRLEDWEGGASAYRGAGGPIKITKQKDLTPASQAFIQAIAETCQVPVIDDYNAGEQEGASIFQQTAKDGLRYSASEAYLHPSLGKPNFQVEMGVTVARVVIEKGRAVGVELIQNGGKRVVRASREVILSAGVIGSAQILMLSGVGPAAHLKEHGIDVVADLPVGDNLHDHLFAPLVFLAPQALHRGTPWHFFSGMLAEWIKGDTWFGRTVFEGAGFVKSHAGAKIPDLQIHALPWSYPAPNQDQPVRPVVDKRPALTVMPTLIYPKSRGEVRLLSSDPTAAPLIDPHFLEEPEDLAHLVRGFKILRQIMASNAMKDLTTGELEPGPKFDTDRAIGEELRNRVCTVYHPVGTCRMGADERAVVDPSLRVRGVEGLRVADAAVIPSVTGGNTNAPCLMIGEKCADLVLGRTAHDVAGRSTLGLSSLSAAAPPPAR